MKNNYCLHENAYTVFSFNIYFFYSVRVSFLSGLVLTESKPYSTVIADSPNKTMKHEVKDKRK